MNCPFCNKTVKDGTSICPHCESVIDDSILGAMPEDEEGEDTPPPAPAPKKPVAKASAGKRPAAARKPAPVAKGEAGSPSNAPASAGKYQNKYSQYWTEDEPSAKPSKGPTSGENVVAELHAQAVKAIGEPEVVDPLVSLKNVWTSFLACHFEDKMTLASAAALIVCTFMPWRTTPDGDDMGLMTNGFFCFLLACVAIGTVWARKTDKLPVVPRAKFPLATLGTGGLAGLVGIIFIIANSIGNKAVKGGQTVILTEPSFGVFLGVVFAAGIVVGGLLTLKREK